MVFVAGPIVVAGLALARFLGEERLEEMRAQYRRQRQQSIAEELLDVVGGFETLRAATGDPGPTGT